MHSEKSSLHSDTIKSKSTPLRRVVHSKKSSLHCNNENLINIKLQKSSFKDQSRNRFSFSLVNTRSVKKRTADVVDYVIGNHTDVCILTETWLTPLDTVHRAQLEPSGYKFKDIPRPARRGGGIGIMYRDSFKVENVSSGCKRSFEFSEWNLSWLNNRLRFCVIYHPPYSEANPVTNKTFLEEFEDYIENVLLSPEPLCIVGDFNLHMDVMDDCYQRQMSDLLNSVGLQQHVNVPTHKSGHILDLIITRCGDKLDVSSPRAGYMITDHCFVLSSFSLPRPNLSVKDISYRDIKSMDMDLFQKDLAEIVEGLLHISDPNVLVSEYNRELRSCLDKHAPCVQKSIVSRPKVEWYTDSLLSLKRKRRKAERTYNLSKSKQDEDIFHGVRNQYVGLLNRAQEDFYCGKIANAAGNQKQLFSIISSLMNSNMDNPLPDHVSLQDLANRFGGFFKDKIVKIRQEIDSMQCSPPDLSPTESPPNMDSFTALSPEEVKKLIMESKSATCDLDPIPTWLVKDCVEILLPVLTKMVNLSLQTGIFPDEWKLALVIPLLKKIGLPLLEQNYRPVSNLAFTSKLAERAVVKQSVSHTKRPDCQSSYREGHSTESALIKVQSDILKNMEKQRVTLLVMIDLSAAFDTVDHSILLSRLQHQFGFTGTALKWFSSYLANRTQCVFINGIRSETVNLDFGVPQGSCLGPILYTQYASSLFNVIQKHLINVHGYADDHQLYMSFSPNIVDDQDKAFTAMENCLLDVKDWMIANKLKMNDSKTEFLIIGSRQQLKKVEYDFIMVGDTSVKVVDHVRNLGAYFDSSLTMSKHIDVKCRNASMHLYSIRKIRKFLTREACETLIHAFIFSQLDYCNALLYDLPDTQIRKLQRIQNFAARVVYKLPKFSHVTELFEELHWLRVRDRIEFKVLLFTFKAINCASTTPSYICEMFKVQQSVRPSRVKKLIVPKVKLETFEARSLGFAGATLWNNLPDYLRSITDLDGFKTGLKTHLYRRAYCS